MKANKHNHTLIEIIQFLSIDVVLGTLAVGYMATRILDVYANPAWWFVLPLAVWVIYTLDHLVDGYKNKSESIIERHRFHYQNRKLLITAVIIISLITTTLSVLYLQRSIIICGILLLIIITFYLGALYFLKNRKSTLLQKELIIAIVYTLGIFLAPIIWYDSLPSLPVLYIIIIICLLAWAEGIMNSWFDYDYDIEDGHNSFTVLFGKKQTQRFLLATHIFIEAVILILLFTLPISINFWVLGILLVMNFFIGLMMLFPESNFSIRYHRIIGEFVFILPALVVFV